MATNVPSGWPGLARSCRRWLARFRGDGQVQAEFWGERPGGLQIRGFDSAGIMRTDAREDGRGKRLDGHIRLWLARGEQFNCLKPEGQVGVGHERTPGGQQAFRYLVEDGPGDSRAERPAHQVQKAGRAAAVTGLIAERP